MNPYTYSRARHMRQDHAPRRSFWRDIVCAEISSVVALAIIVFATGSVMTLSYLAGSGDALGGSAMGVAHAAAARPQVLGDSTTAPRVGQVVYNTSNRTVYLVGGSGLYGFPNAATFYSWGFTFSQVTAENSGEQALGVIGTVPTKQSGCNSPLDQINGTCSSTTGSSLTMPGNSSNNNASARVGQLIYSPASHTIYLVGSNALYAFTDAQTFFSWGFSFNNILPANRIELALPVSNTFVPTKQSGCNSPLDQINGTCNGSSAPALTILSPAGGEQLVAGQTTLIRWTSTGIQKVSIGLCGNSTTLGLVCSTLSAIPDAGIDASSGQYSWYIDPNSPYIPGSNLKIRIIALGKTLNFDSNSFSISRIASDGPRVGSLINRNNTVYLVGQNGLYGFPDILTFSSWNYSFSQIVTANSAEQAMSQIGVVPAKQSGCNNALDQINGSCGNVNSLALTIGLNSAVSNPLPVTANATNQKVASFVVSAPNTSAASISSLTITATRNTINNNFQNLTVLVNGTRFGVTQVTVASYGVYTFTGSPIIIPANGTLVLDVYSDVAANVTADNFNVVNQPLVYLSALSGFWPANESPLSISQTVPGQNLTLGGPSSFAPLNATLSPASPVAQFVTSNGLTQPIAIYNFTSGGGSAIIQQMVFTVPGPAIGMVYVNGVSAPVVGNTATVAGLNIAVPSGYGGVNVPVAVSYGQVGANGVPSNSPASVTLSSVRYIIGSASQSVTPNISSNTMRLAASYPTVTLVSSNNQLTTGSVVVAKIVVNANASGDVVLTGLPVSLVMSTGGFMDYNKQFTLTDDATGQQVASYPVVGAGGDSFTFAINSGNRIAAGTSKTYDVTVPVANITGNSVTLSLTLGSASGLTFNDANGGGTGLTGSLITNYPSNTVVITGAGSSVAGSLSVSPTSMAFNASYPSGQALTLSGVSGQWIASVASSGNWLMINGSTNGATGVIGSTGINVTVNPNSQLNLAAGTYQGSITINSYDSPARFASVTVPVTLVVPATNNTNLQITPGILPAATIGQPYSTQLMVSGGTGPYTWSVINTTYGSGCCVLGLNGNSQPLYGNTVNFNTQTSSAIVDTYPAGTYYWTIQVKDANGNTVTKAVSLTINAASQVMGNLTATPTALNFSATQGSNPAPQYVRITNNSAATITYTAIMNPSNSWLGWAVNLNGNSAWTIQPYSHIDIPLTVYTANMSAGTYAGSFGLSGNFSNSPIMVPINVMVSAAAPSQPTLSDSLDPVSPPAGQVAAGQVGVAFVIVRFTSTGGDSSLSTVSIAQNPNESQVSNIKVYDMSTGQLLGSVANLSNNDPASGQKWASVFFGSNWVIPNGSSRSLKIVADVPAGASGNMKLGVISVGSNNINQQFTLPVAVYGNYLAAPVQ